MEQEITLRDLCRVSSEEHYPEGFDEMMKELEATRQNAILLGDEEWLKELNEPTNPNERNYFP